MTKTTTLDLDQPVGRVMRDMLQIVDEIGCPDSVHKLECDSMFKLGLIKLECWDEDLTLAHVVAWCDRVGAEEATIELAPDSITVVTTSEAVEFDVQAEFHPPFAELPAGFEDAPETVSVDWLRKMVVQVAVEQQAKRDARFAAYQARQVEPLPTWQGSRRLPEDERGDISDICMAPHPVRGLCARRVHEDVQHVCATPSGVIVAVWPQDGGAS